MKSLYLIALLALLTGCGEEPKVAGANYISLDGRPVPEGAPLEAAVDIPPPNGKVYVRAESTHVFYPDDGNGSPDYSRAYTADYARQKLKPLEE